MKRIATLLVAAGVSAPAFAHDGSRAAGCSAIAVTAPGLPRQPRDLEFSTRTMLDLEFATRLERTVYGDHVLRFRVFTPSGFLYQELSAPFSWPRPGRKALDPAAADGPASTGKVQVLGKSSRRGGPTTLSARLPVAGTSITMSTLYGRWSVQAFLDGASRPCSAVRHFTIHSK